MGFWTTCGAVYVGIILAIITIEIGSFGLNYFLTRRQRRFLEGIQDRAARDALTEADMKIIGTAITDAKSSLFSPPDGPLDVLPDQMKPPASGTHGGGSGQYL